MQTERSISAFWEIVPATSCNFSCLTCYAAENSRPDSRLLDWKQISVAIDRATNLGITNIDILGGEPLAYKFLESFISYFKNKVPNGFCGVVSNGSLITREKAKSLFNSGIDQVTVSLDGTTAEINDANRGKGSFEKAIAGINNLHFVGIPFTIAYTVTPFNLEDTNKVPLFAQKLNARAVAFQIAEMEGRAKIKLKDYSYFNHIEGLRSICKAFDQKSSIYIGVSTRSKFKEFLNTFFNAGLGLPNIKCSGGVNTFMISSGGDIFPCSTYAYFPNGSAKNEGINLVQDSLMDIEEFATKKYAKFNEEMGGLEKSKFYTCLDCTHKNHCAPCPIINSQGFVSECEWVKEIYAELEKNIMRSSIKLLTEAKVASDSEIQFTVPTQENPLIIPIGINAFNNLISSSPEQIILKFSDKETDPLEAKNRVINFLCKLRSHQVIEIDGFKKMG